MSRVKRIDLAASWLISLGGVAIIASMLLMIVFIFKVAFPLFQSPSSKIETTFEGRANPIAIGTGPYLENGIWIEDDGTVKFIDVHSGKLLTRMPLPLPSGGDARIVSTSKTDNGVYSLFWQDGSVSSVRIRIVANFLEDNQRILNPELDASKLFPPIPNIDPRWPKALRVHDTGVTRVHLDPKGRVYVQTASNDRVEHSQVHWLDAGVEGLLTNVVLTRDGRQIFVGTNAGELVAWEMLGSEPRRAKPVKPFADHRPISAMTMLFGDVSLVVGDEAGRLSAWNLPIQGDDPVLVKIHELHTQEGAIRELTASYRNKSFAVRDASGNICLHHLTSNQKLLCLEPDPEYTVIDISSRGDAIAAVDRKSNFRLWSINVPHPEVNARTLWRKIWYESYPEPDYVWQSSAASDDFEPKLSLVPLVFGSLKGTFYGMLFSLPLALFAALYVSHMMHPRWRAVIKPVIELMAAVPTVVIGFLAALWLAPRFEGNLLALIFALGIIPAVVGIGMYTLFRRSKKITGIEFVWAVPLVILGAFLAYQLGLVVQDTYFGGSLNLWLFTAFDMNVDQRNCVVIAFALGFAVIPIIFTISEDAMYNVPKSLTAAAMALGSSRWQTVRRVVLPVASPGIFAASMIGFGRAVGETMIVLMATGNTAIMSPNILNGMRTLSANIAVEIPEAPVDSSLYRVLFLSALLLFAMTFVINTLAEFVRVRLNRRFHNM